MTTSTQAEIDLWKADLEILKRDEITMSNLTVRALVDRLTDVFKALADARERTERDAEDLVRRRRSSRMKLWE